MILGAGEGPVSLLRPFLVHLRDPRRLSRLQAGILDLLQPSPDPFSRTPVNFPEISGELSKELRLDLRRSIATHLFGWDALLCQRMRFSLAEFCQVCHALVRWCKPLTPVLESFRRVNISTTVQRSLEPYLF